MLYHDPSGKVIQPPNGTIINVMPVINNDIRVYKQIVTNPGDSNYQDELDRWMFVQYAALPINEETKAGKFVTIDGKPVFIGGPSQGKGRATAK